MSLPQALDIAMRLKEALTREVSRSQQARAVLKTLDAPAMIAQVTERETFNLMSASLSAELGNALAAFANSHGHSELTLADIRRLAPFEGEQLSGVFAEIRALSRALSELDEVNQQLAERALTVVRAYVTHLAPAPTRVGDNSRPSKAPRTRSAHERPALTAAARCDESAGAAGLQLDHRAESLELEHRWVRAAAG